jgi:hypothetical protein
MLGVKVDAEAADVTLGSILSAEAVAVVVVSVIALDPANALELLN